MRFPRATSSVVEPVHLHADALIENTHLHIRPIFLHRQVGERLSHGHTASGWPVQCGGQSLKGPRAHV